MSDVNFVMIDYEKLKLAHELAIKLSDESRISSTVSQFFYGASQQVFYKYNSYEYGEHCFDSIDKLITKLQELIQPKPKYKVGQEVWFNDGDTPESFNVSKAKFSYGLNEFTYDDISESELYPSREALIESQIEYWESLRQDMINDVKVLHDESKKKWENYWETYKECEHETDGIIYRIETNDVPRAMNKCKKCGEYYK